jgi:hypothetical protein
VLTRSRLLWAVPLALLLVAGLWTAWLTWSIAHDLGAAETEARNLQAALVDGDATDRDRSVDSFRDASASAASRTEGAWWGMLTHLPFVGDDATGVRALSRSLDTIATDATEPLLESVDSLDGLTRDGRVDLDVVGGLARPVSEAHQALAAAHAQVSNLDSSGYAGPMRSRFDKFVELTTDATSGLASAEKATKVLPAMLGRDAPRDYLLIFQNNAEIRATGGMPGSWALAHAEDGELRLTRQGTAGDFPTLDGPVLPLSEGELAVYDEPLGIYFQDPGFTPDYPRAAELWRAHWDRKFPTVPLDGVVSLDPVALSYLLEGTGPVRVGDTTLTADTLVPELLNKPYLELEPAAQDALFQEVARAIFTATTGDLASPVGFVRGLNRSASEGRFLVASFDPRVMTELAGTRVEGALTTEDGTAPEVDIGLNDATGSKMSYYLRYWAEVRATGCRAGVQELSGSMTVNQRISPADAATLPVSVTGGGNYGTDPGSQLVVVRIYGPSGGAIGQVHLNGKVVGDAEVVQLDGRPVTTLVVELSNRDDVVINWTMKSADGQTGDPRLGLTPSIVPGSNDATVTTAC